MSCPGNSIDHCCYVNGERCKYLEEDTVNGRHWVCGLRRELGSWQAVHADPRYRSEVRPHWDKSASLAGYECGDWPPPGIKCESCGQVG